MDRKTALEHFYLSFVTLVLFLFFFCHIFPPMSPICYSYFGYPWTFNFHFQHFNYAVIVFFLYESVKCSVHHLQAPIASIHRGPSRVSLNTRAKGSLWCVHGPTEVKDAAACITLLNIYCYTNPKSAVPVVWCGQTFDLLTRAPRRILSRLTYDCTQSRPHL